MMKRIPIRRRTKPTEEGYILVAVIFMLAILMISLSIAAPAIKKEIQRDRELETMQRGKQYARAIKMYYKKFGAYPPNVDALVKTSNIRFLRKKYIDPTTGKDEWKPVRFGQNKAPTAMGFFGQPLAGSTLAGIGPSGGNGVAGATTLGSGLSSTTGSSTMFGSGSSGSSSGTGTTSASGTTTGTGTDSGSTSGGTGGTDSSSGSTSASATGLSGQTGQTFGGAGIIGFSPNSPKQSILVYKKKNHYNEWEFVYDPLADRTVVSSSSGAGGQSAGSMTTGVGGSSFGSSSSFGGSSIGSGASSSPTSTTTPQQ
jgi:type II secretory pathway pseudopilin PulG